MKLFTRTALLLLSALIAPASAQAGAQDDWFETYEIIPKSGYGSPTNHFGQAISFNGDRVIVGSPTFNNGHGEAFLFEPKADGWQQVCRFTPSVSQADDAFGESTALGSDFVVVGAPGHDNERGAVFIYEETQGGFSETRLAPSSGSRIEYGTSLAVFGPWLFVGAPDGGRTYVYRRTVNGWNLLQILTGDGIGSDSEFGASVAVHGSVALVGAPRDQSVRVFRLIGGQWDERLVLDRPAGSGNRFGASVAFDGYRALVGSPKDDREGRAHLYDAKVNGWPLVHTFSRTDLPMEAEFGFSVALDQHHAVVGAPGDGTVLGSAHVYEETVWWDEVGSLFPTVTGDGEFGKFVAVCDGAVLTNIGLDDAPVFGFYAGAVKVWNEIEPRDVELRASSQASGRPGLAGGGNAFGGLPTLSVSRGGRLELELAGGLREGGKVYLLLGSLSGTSPGVPLAQGHLPLNPDDFLALTARAPQRALLTNSQGVLDPQGLSGTISFDVPPGVLTSLAGQRFSFAAMVMHGLDLRTATGTNALSVTLLP